MDTSDTSRHPARQVGRSMGWVSNPNWQNPKDRQYDIRETGALPVRGVFGGSVGRRTVTLSSPTASVTGPFARTKRGAKKEAWKSLGDDPYTTLGGNNG